MSNSSTGISTIDMMGMPGPIRRIIRIMLRKSTLDYESILAAVEKLPEEKRPTSDEVDEALEALVSMEWLFRYEEDGKIIYSVKIAKKEGSEKTRTGTRQNPNQSDKMGELWGALDEGAEAANDGMTAQEEMTKMQANQRQKASSVVDALNSVDEEGVAELQDMAAEKAKRVKREDLEKAKKAHPKTEAGDITASPTSTHAERRSAPPQKDEQEDEDDKPGFFARLFGLGKKK